jgi:hypothetical protein
MAQFKAVFLEEKCEKLLDFKPGLPESEGSVLFTLARYFSYSILKLTLLKS